MPKAKSPPSKARPSFPRGLPPAKLTAADASPSPATARWLWWLSHIVYSESVDGITADAAPWELLGFLDARRSCGSAVDPQAAIFEHTPKRGGPQLVVAFRGTEPLDLVDWVTDAHFDLVPWSGGRDAEVHQGFQMALEAKVGTAKRDRSVGDWARPRPLVDLLADLVEERQAPVWLTGHSLGGALATLAGAALADRGLGRWLPGIYTFGAPRVGDETFRYIYEEELGLGGRTFRYVNDLDIVPRVPFDTREMGPLNPLGWLLKAADQLDAGFLGHLDDLGGYRHVGVEVALGRELRRRHDATPSAPSLDMSGEEWLYARTHRLPLPFFARWFTDHFRLAYRDKVWSA